MVKSEGLEILVQGVAHNDGAVAAEVEEGCLGVAQGPGGRAQLLLRDAVDVRARVRDGQSGGHEGVDQHLCIDIFNVKIEN